MLCFLKVAGCPEALGFGSGALGPSTRVLLQVQGDPLSNHSDRGKVMERVLRTQRRWAESEGILGEEGAVSPRIVFVIALIHRLPCGGATRLRRQPFVESMYIIDS